MYQKPLSRLAILMLITGTHSDMTTTKHVCISKQSVQYYYVYQEHIVNPSSLDHNYTSKYYEMDNRFPAKLANGRNTISFSLNGLPKKCLENSRLACGLTTNH